MKDEFNIPSLSQLEARLGNAIGLWTEVVDSVSENFGSIDQVWKPSKSDFGKICLLNQKKRTLLYMTPEDGLVRVAIVLGERAVGIALESDLSKEIKDLIREARQYAEGRGIRFDVRSAADVSSVVELIRIKTIPK